jgi:hypothetical protein
MTVSTLGRSDKTGQTRHRRPSSLKLAQAEQAVTRARKLQGERLDEHVIEVLPAMATLLPEGGLRAGSTYGIDGSTALTAALLAGPSSDGLWCGVVGMPGFAAEAAAALGCDLDHLVVVPWPGRDWINIVATLIDAMTVVVVRPLGHVSDGEAARLGARLRQRDAVLIACGPWPRTETRLSVLSSAWQGLGTGHGHLTSRRVTIGVAGRGSRRQRRPGKPGATGVELWLPDPTGQVRLVDETARVWTTRHAPDVVEGDVHEAAG